MARVLVVDDDASVCSALADQLKDAEHQVETASSAAEAIARIPEDYDVMVVDMRMEADESGLEVLQTARNHDRFCQVIVLTGYGTASNAVKAMEMGAFAYVLKESDATLMVLQQVRRALQFTANWHAVTMLTEAIDAVHSQLQGIPPLISGCLAQLNMVAEQQKTLLSKIESRGENTE